MPARVTDRALDVLLDRVKQANGGDLADDVGMLFVRCVTVSSTSEAEDTHQDLSMSFRLPVDRASVRAARHAIEELCGRLHVPLHVRANLRLAVTEACANVVLHAYPTPQAGEFEVEARAVPGESVEVIVRDYGGGMGRESTSPGAGLGLSLIGTLTSHHEIRPAAQSGARRSWMTFDLATERETARRRRRRPPDSPTRSTVRRVPSQPRCPAARDVRVQAPQGFSWVVSWLTTWRAVVWLTDQWLQRT